jgi:hypothetical protein
MFDHPACGSDGTHRRWGEAGFGRLFRARGAQGGAKRVRPDHEVTMKSASPTLLAFHGHRRTRSAAPCFMRAHG